MHERGGQRRLTSDEVALVLRRAAEIDAGAQGPHSGDTDTDADADRYDAAAVEAAAGEVGVSPAAVQHAVAELQVGALTPDTSSARAGRVATSPTVVEQRLVAPRPEAALGRVETLLRRQMLEARRRTSEHGLFRPREDLAAKVARRLDFTGAIRLDGVESVAVHATPAGDRTLVHVEATLTTSRSEVVAGSAGTGAAVALVGGLGGALAAEPAFVVAALPAGAAVAAGGIRVRGRRWRQQRAQVAEVIANILDRL